jgi:hypothetical protein
MVITWLNLIDYISKMNNKYYYLEIYYYLCLKYIRDSNCEIGLHSEVIDCSKKWSELDSYCLRRGIQILDKMLEINISGVASHNGLTGNNNLDFWKDKNTGYYNLVYEAYDRLLFNNFYCSDSLVTKWKCYSNGIEAVGDERCICEHLKDNHRVIYCLTHPEQYENL